MFEKLGSNSFIKRGGGERALIWLKKDNHSRNNILAVYTDLITDQVLIYILYTLEGDFIDSSWIAFEPSGNT